MKKLAEQLFANQGHKRFSIENRLYVVFDRSTTSSTRFLQLNEHLMTTAILKMLQHPERHWFPINYEGHQVLVCIIFIPQDQYKRLDERSEHPIGDGLREPDKAEFHKKFLKTVASLSGGTIIPNENENQHGIDAYIYLPTTVCQSTLLEVS
jgi:hypothetical protein